MSLFNLARYSVLMAGIWGGVAPQSAFASDPRAGVTARLGLERGVGSVTLALGRAYINRGDERLLVEKGLSVAVGDQIFTENSGHVHVRFVDGALVSVRPASTLDINRYDFDRRRPEQSAVKFSLSEGVARSISGQAAKSARQRFRLNTPIAAIGVRGTDFVVSANSRSTTALVNEGIIVLAPFSSGCTIDALGPCTENGVELAGDSFQTLELNRAVAIPQLRQEEPQREIASLNERFGLVSDRSAQRGSGSNPEDVGSVYRESVTSNQVNQASEQGKSAGSGESVSFAFDYTPDRVFGASDVASAQLVWGRFTQGKGPSEVLSVDRQLAAQDRVITIAASDYLLYRAEPNGTKMDAGIGMVGFSLDSAQAFYETSSGEFTMRVAEGDLNIDFINSEFATNLNLDHALTGPILFSANGRVAPGGYLIGNNDSSTSIVGAVSIDAAEAAYYFQQNLLDGAVNGLTIWGGQ